MEATATGGPPRFFALAAVGGGVVLAGTCGRGVSRSTDGGATWAPSAEPGWVNDFAGTGPLFAATERAGVHRSDDGGLTWTATGLDATTTYAVLVTGSSVLAGTADAGVQRSDDGGATWRPVGDFRGTVYRLRPRTDGGVLVGTGGHGVLRLDEDLEPVGLDGLTVYALAELPGGAFLAGTKEAGLRRSDDGGLTWGASGDGLPDDLVHCLALDHDGAVLAGTGRGVARSEDGRRWEPLGGDLSERRVFSLAADANGVVLGGSYDGVWRRTDGWSVVDTGLCDDAFAVAVVAGGEVLGGSASGQVRVSADGGATWRAAADAVDGSPHAFLRCADGRLLLGFDAGVLIAAGDRWRPAGLDGERVFCLLEPEPGVVLAGTLGSGVHRWTAGDGWRSVPGIGERMVLDLLVTPTGAVLAAVADVVAGAKTGGIHRSDDGGATWRPSPAPPIAVYRLAQASTGTLLAGAQRSGILRSTDDGATWCEVATTGLAGAKTYALVTDGDDRAYLGAGTGVWWSDDEGGTWTAIESPALDGLTVFDLAAHPSGAVVAATSAGFLRTTDGGATWR